MKNYLMFTCILFFVFLCIDCKSVKQERILREQNDLGVQFISKWLWRAISSDLACQTEFNTTIFVDTNLVFRENLYHADGTKIFSWVPELCQGFDSLAKLSKPGVLSVPDSMKQRIRIIREPFDFEQDSFSYFLASMPVYLKDQGIYAVQVYKSYMHPFHKTLTVGILYFDKNGKFLWPCPDEMKSKSNSFDSQYWLQFLQPKRCGPECQARNERVFEVYKMLDRDTMIRD
jgi:hypothetical protein